MKSKSLQLACGSRREKEEEESDDEALGLQRYAYERIQGDSSWPSDPIRASLLAPEI